MYNLLDTELLEDKNWDYKYNLSLLITTYQKFCRKLLITITHSLRWDFAFKQTLSHKPIFVQDLKIDQGEFSEQV